MLMLYALDEDPGSQLTFPAYDEDDELVVVRSSERGVLLDQRSFFQIAQHVIGAGDDAVAGFEAAGDFDVGGAGDAGGDGHEVDAILAVDFGDHEDALHLL